MSYLSNKLAVIYITEVLSIKDVIIITFYYNQICKTAKKTEDITTVKLKKEDINFYLIFKVQVTCENSNSNVTLLDNLETLKKIIIKIKKTRLNILVKKLQVKMIYHLHKLFLSDININSC